MKWYWIAAITMVFILGLYAYAKLFGKTNVYYNIEDSPAVPIPKKEAKSGSCGGMSNLGDTSLPLGFRNNNPLNLIKSSNAWKGKLANPAGRFEEFCSMEYGTRAAMINLRTYINRYGRNTIRKIISKWAPATENATNSYIDFVVRQTGIAPDTPISFQKEFTFKLIDAMSRMENGAVYAVDDLIKEKAWGLIKKSRGVVPTQAGVNKKGCQHLLVAFFIQ